VTERIAFDHVTLRRRLQEEFSYDLKRTLFSIIERRLRIPRRLTVIDNLSLSVMRGEKLGLVGPNGSGKSTLLKLICGILRPSSGTVRVSGSIAPLIELGAGFDLDLSVEDNIIYYGVLLGHTRDRMRAAASQVLEFSELVEYRKVPLKALSSGMAARLGFAVATEVQPDILLLDEVFAVGDESFRRKSAARLRELWDGDHTIVLVSHDLTSVAEQCERAVWLEHGMVRAVGPAAEIVAKYAASVSSSARLAVAERLSSLHGVGNVDQLTFDQEHSTLALYGWALSPGAERVGTTVGVFVDGHFLQEAAYGEPRSDVADALSRQSLLQCGFHGTFSLTALTPGTHQVVIAIFDHATQEFHPFGESYDVIMRDQCGDSDRPAERLIPGQQRRSAESAATSRIAQR